MIVFREREKTSRRVSLGRAANFIWVILVFALISFLFLSIHHNETTTITSTTSNTSSRRSTRSTSSSSNSISRSHSSSIRPPPFRRTMFHAPPSTSTTTNIVGDTEHSVYEDDKRIIHTGPNPLHN